MITSDRIELRYIKATHQLVTTNTNKRTSRKKKSFFYRFSGYFFRIT